MAKKPMKATATYADYEDADAGRVDEMKAIIAANGGEVVFETGGEAENEYVIGFRHAVLDEYNRIEALGADAGWELERR